MVSKCMAVTGKQKVENGKIIDARGGFECSQCPRIFFIKEQLLRHVNRTHCDSTIVKIPSDALGKLVSITITKSNNGKFKCPLCPSFLSTKGSIDSHVVKHALSLKKSQCKKCDQVFSSEVKLQTHVSSHHKNQVDIKDVHNPGLTIKVQRSQDGSFVCPYCFITCKTSQGIKRHCLYVIIEPTQNNRCNDCGISYLDKKTVISHNYRYHSKSTSFTPKTDLFRAHLSRKCMPSNGKYNVNIKGLLDIDDIWFRNQSKV
ncbi:hypothetical protein K501DRAFT_271110 [Backusella circina FSU 941]|nr:hypothetical protein K501DRAFT_271110 [Backusella circina FSU 941]